MAPAIVQLPRVDAGAELRLRARFFSCEPGLVSSNSKRAVVLSTKARLGSARPPNLDSQYRPVRNNCQEFNAGDLEKVTKCTSGCD